MNQINEKLPRTYLSYSAWKLWRTSKPQFRKRYYDNEPSFDTIETRFGKMVAEWIENDDPRVKHIPKYATREYKLDVLIEGTIIHGRLDGLDQERIRFMDHKSGHATSTGEAPWNPIKVRKLDQLPFYSWLLHETFGKVNPWCHLIWIETEFTPSKVEWNGHTLNGPPELRLTGRVKKFRRYIRKWERERIKKDVLLAIKEIEIDYANYRNQPVHVGDSKEGTQEVPPIEGVLPGDTEEVSRETVIK